MSLVQKYRRYRRLTSELVMKIIKTHLHNIVQNKAARLLGILRGDLMLFRDEEETNVLMDFALYEGTMHGKNAIEIYREKRGEQNETEQEILDALLAAYTSLFKVHSISEAERMLLLSDLLNKKDNIPLIDIGLSQTAAPGMLLFIRVVPFKEFNMTSGIIFAFPSDLETYLLQRYKELGKTVKVRSKREAVARFVAFFRLNETHGIEAHEGP